MGRPPCHFRIGYCPRFRCFRPEGSRGRHAKPIALTPQEAEALRLKNLADLDQTQSAARMGVSQSSFQRVLHRAYRKVTEALIYGKPIIITKE